VEWFLPFLLGVTTFFILSVFGPFVARVKELKFRLFPSRSGVFPFFVSLFSYPSHLFEIFFPPHSNVAHASIMFFHPYALLLRWRRRALPSFPHHWSRSLFLVVRFSPSGICGWVFFKRTAIFPSLFSPPVGGIANSFLLFPTHISRSLRKLRLFSLSSHRRYLILMFITSRAFRSFRGHPIFFFFISSSPSPAKGEPESILLLFKDVPTL